MTATHAEIERKFVLRGLPTHLECTRRGLLEQGYFADGRPELHEDRLRWVRDGDRTSYLRTIKTGKGLARTEAEERLDAEEFLRLWPATSGRRIQKVRYCCELDATQSGQRPVKLKVDVDEYLGRLGGLWIGEVEFVSEAEAGKFVPPDWFGREVTGDPRFSNRALAERTNLEGLLDTAAEQPAVSRIH